MGAGMASGTAPMSSPTPLVFVLLTINDLNDESIFVLLGSLDDATRTAMVNGKTQGTGNRMNGTVTLTVTNTTEDPDKVGVKTFNIFQYVGTTTVFYFLSDETEDITISDASAGGDFYQVDLTADDFLDSGGSAAGLGVTGSSAEFNFSAVINIPGDFLDETITASAISIDAA